MKNQIQKKIKARFDSESHDYVAFKVPFSLEGFSENEKKALYHMQKACSLMNPIFLDQTGRELVEAKKFLSGLLEKSEGYDKETFQEYADAINLQNSFFDDYMEKSAILEESIVNSFSAKLGIDEMQEVERSYESLKQFFSGSAKRKEKRNFYPEDFTDEDFAKTDGAGLTNTMIVKENGKFVAKTYEEVYKERLGEVIEHLDEASKLIEDNGFKDYLNAKIKSLREGTPESIEEAEKAWLNHDYKIDLIIDTAGESYDDGWKKTKGSAGATLAVAVQDKELAEKYEKLKSLLPIMERDAPWSEEFKKEPTRGAEKVVVYDIITWTGQCIGTGTTIGRSWPNNNKNGRKSMIHNNLMDLIDAEAEHPAGKIMKSDVYGSTKDSLLLTEKLQVALHELGHSTGKLKAGLKDSAETLKEYDSFIEEARAELLAFHFMPNAKELGVLTDDELEAFYHNEAVSLVMSVRKGILQDHAKSRNMILHFFEERGAVVNENGYRADIAKFKEASKELLGIVGNIRGAGDYGAAKKLSEDYVYEDERKKEISELLSYLPKGRGFIFPEITEDGKVEYKEFSEQQHYMEE